MGTKRALTASTIAAAGALSVALSGCDLAFVAGHAALRADRIEQQELREACADYAPHWLTGLPSDWERQRRDVSGGVLAAIDCELAERAMIDPADELLYNPYRMLELAYLRWALTGERSELALELAVQFDSAELGYMFDTLAERTDFAPAPPRHGSRTDDCLEYQPFQAELILASELVGLDAGCREVYEAMALEP